MKFAVRSLFLLGVHIIASPIGVQVTSLRMIDPLICMRAKIITLCLSQILRKSRGAVAVKVRKARAHRGDWYADTNCSLYSHSPIRLRRLHPAVKLFVEKQVWQIRPTIVCVHYRIQEPSANYTSTLPYPRHLAEINSPFVFFGSSADKAQSLCV